MLFCDLTPGRRRAACSRLRRGQLSDGVSCPARRFHLRFFPNTHLSRLTRGDPTHPGPANDASASTSGGCLARQLGCSPLVILVSTDLKPVMGAALHPGDVRRRRRRPHSRPDHRGYAADHRPASFDRPRRRRATTLSAGAAVGRDPVHLAESPAAAMQSPSTCAFGARLPTAQGPNAKGGALAAQSRWLNTGVCKFSPESAITWPGWEAVTRGSRRWKLRMTLTVPRHITAAPRQ